MIIEKLKNLGYTYEPALLDNGVFYQAVRVGNLIFTSGQIPLLGEIQIKGKVGSDINIQEAQKAAEICAFNCFRAVGSIIDIEEIDYVVKILGMVNVAENFNNTSEVINGASLFLNQIFDNKSKHARSAVGMTLPGNWAVEVEMIVAIKG